LLLEGEAAGRILDQADPQSVVEAEHDVNMCVDADAVLAHISLVDRVLVARPCVELALQLEPLLVRVGDVGVVHPCEFVGRVAEHALQGRIRLAHDPAPADRDADRGALEDHAELPFGVLGLQA